MKRLFFLVIALLTTVPAIAETRKYGPLTLDFGRAQKMGQSTVVPGVNPQKQPLFIAVLCENRLFNFTGAELKWNNWNKPATIYEAKIIADVCNFIWDKQIHPCLPLRVRTWRRSASSGRWRCRRRWAWLLMLAEDSVFSRTHARGNNSPETTSRLSWISLAARDQMLGAYIWFEDV